MTRSQNLASSQRGNQTIIDYMQDVKRNIESLDLMNVSVDFDELSIHVLNELTPANSNISHALQDHETPITFEELFEQLPNYEAQMKISVPSSSPTSTSTIALVALARPSSNRQSNNRG